MTQLIAKDYSVKNWPNTSQYKDYYPHSHRHRNMFLCEKHDSNKPWSPIVVDRNEEFIKE